MKISIKLLLMAKSSDSKKKILLADDSVTMHRAVSLALKNDDYELICCDNGKDALRLMYEHHPVVALLDLDMPEKTGIEVAQDAKSDPSLSSTQLVLLCGSFDEVDENEVEKAPVDGRLWKPFESNVLTTLLKTLLDARNQSNAQSPTGLATPEAQSAMESTSENSGSTHGKENVFEAPISKKDALLKKEEHRVSKSLEHEHARSQHIKSSVEPTSAMSVDDLFAPKHVSTAPTSDNLGDIEFNPASNDIESNMDLEDTGAREAFEETSFELSESPQSSDSISDDDSDFSRSLTNETFHKIIHDDELPPPKGAKEQSAAKPKEDPLAQNLWSAEDMSPMSETSHFSDDDEEQTRTEYHAMGTSNLDDIDFEILSHHESPASPPPQLQDNVQESANDWLGEQHRKMATPELDEVVKQSEFDAAQRVKAELKSPSFQDHQRNEGTRVELPNDELVKNLVQAEVQRVFNAWLKDELKRQLDQVLTELDSDL
ncbi:response regulator [bacterium]|nr:response regulator [bacterium]